MGLLDGKVAAITGAGGGLGRAYALLFASEGCKVVVNDLGGAMDGSGGGNAMADHVVKEIEAAGGEAVANYASVSDEDGAQSIVDDAVNAFGKLDILVNNAGILRDKTLLKLETPNFDLVMAVHARGTFLCGKAAAAQMKAQGTGGSIINTSSIAGLKGNFGQTNYACAKAGIAGMTRVWGMELRRARVRCNAIAPMAKTRMTADIDAVPDDITPEQIAPMALYLASDLSEAVTGRIFGCHGRHMFEYHQQLSPGVEIPEGLWTADMIHERLEEISAMPAAKAPEGGGGDSLVEQCDQIVNAMPAAFVPEKAGSWASVIHFEITGTGSWGVTVSDGKCIPSKGRPDGAKCNLTYDSGETFVATMTGKASAQQAFMGGKIKADNMADLMKFSQCFDMKKAAAMAKGGGEKTLGQKVDGFFEGLPTAFKAEKAGSWSTVIHFEVKGTGSYTVSVSDGACTSSRGKPDDAKCNITYDSGQTVLDIATGKANPQQAFMNGKISADNMSDLMKFAQCFDAKKAAALVTGDDGGSREGGMSRSTIGKPFRTSAEFVREEHTRAYAAATNDDNPAFVGDGGVVAPPIFPVRLLQKVVQETVIDPELNADLLRLVHGEQDMRFLAPIAPWDLLAARATIVDIEEKGSGELIKVRQQLMRDGDPVMEVVSGYFVRGSKKKDGGAKKPAPAEPEARELLFETTYGVDEDQSYRYAEASLDKNLIHVDPETAKAAGHPGVIMHGLCTMAMTCRELVDNLCDRDPGRLKRLKVRFSKPVLPGETLTTRAWLVEESNGTKTVGLETENQDGKLVISNAVAEIGA